MTISLESPSGLPSDYGLNMRPRPQPRSPMYLIVQDCPGTVGAIKSSRGRSDVPE